MDHYSLIQKMCKEVQALQPMMAAWRRDFHKYPETAWLEMRTSAVIASQLRQLGWQILTGRQVCLESARMGLPSPEVMEAHALRAVNEGICADDVTDDMKAGFTGVIGILDCGPGPVVGLRFDIDALGMVECSQQEHRPAREGFASTHPGMMHACGHDGHAAMGLGIAHILTKLRPYLHGKVKLFFQPGEEGARGAKAMVAAGHLDDVEFFIGSHVAPTNGPDDGDVTPGTWGSLATTKYDVIFHGLSAHAGGFPENGRNALLAACQAVQALYAIPRHSAGQSRINVGTLHAGTGRNVIADTAQMQIEVRGETTEINRYMMENAQRICRAAADMNGCTCEIAVMGEAEGQRSDLQLLEHIAQVVERDLPALRVSSQSNAQNWGSEDISVMMNRVQEKGGQATYMRMMTDMAGDQHTVLFDFDEDVLFRGAEVFCAAVLDIMGV